MQTEEMMHIRDRAEMEDIIQQARKEVPKAKEKPEKNERLRELYKLLGERRKVKRWWR